MRMIKKFKKRHKIRAFFKNKSLKKNEVRGNLLCLKCIVVGKGKNVKHCSRSTKNSRELIVGQI
jgi:hypothetical protein